ncbi:hypothetical protein B0H63DRAFT_429268 [Podospora didyma]|uniref:Uncharacterized protein n=1 Tax=Podospora didyma TaxID=330526 RepID=A0AAE0NZM3_9PEZI|nr:hypothetical protein B0H63DRAFT_429268 [Podospora didyma]
MHASEGPVTLTRTLDNSVGNAGGPPAGFAPSDVLKSTITSYVDDPKATSTSNSKGAGYAGSEKHGKEGPVTLENTLVEDPTAITTTVVRQTTLPGIVSTITGQTTFSEVRTLGKAVVSDYAEVLTTKTLLTANAAGAYYYSYETVRVLTLTDSNGVSTATVIRTPPVFYTPTVVTLSNSAGVPTATLSTSALVAPRVTTLKNSDGVPTATVTEYPAYPSGNSSSRTTPKQQQPQTVIQVYYMSNAQYFTGFFLPPILSVMLTIPIRMIDLSAKQFQPWHELTRRQGATAYESLCLKTDGFYGIASSIRSLAGGQALIFLTTLLTLCSVILVPLSAEAIALKLHGSCSVTDFRGCAMTLGVFLAPARAAMALLGLMVVLVVLILIVLYRWRSGVASNPWTITGTASLSTNPEVRALLRALPAGRDERIQHNQLLKALDGRTFKLGYFFNRHGVPEYGIMIHQEVRPLSRDSESTSLEKGDGPETEGMTHKTGHHLPFLMLSYKGRISFLVLLTGVMIVILYYNTTSGDSPFESFMDTSNFGVRALFTLVGVGITFSWSSFFTSLAVLSPYQLLAQARQPAERSIILSPPLNAFVGIWSAIRRRHVFLVIVAFTAILSEFMPLLLSNVPFRVTQTWTTHLVCTWLATAILGVMWLVVAGGFFVRWPHMPVDPSTIAGAMYYVCDSWVVWSLEGLSVLGEKERDRKVQAMGLKYELGNIVGLEGRRRIGVDGIHDHS